MMYLVDSNVLSEPSKERPDPGVMHWLTMHSADICTCTLVFGEIERGIDKLGRTKKAQRLQAWYEELSLAFYAKGQVLDIDKKVISYWASLYNREEKMMKRKPPIFDSLLLATAESHDLILATRNARDFSTEAKICDPWKHS
jgi:toxin FitB